MALDIISVEVAKNYQIVCFAKDKNKIKIGIVDPGNFKAFEAVDFLAKEEGWQVEYYLISKAGFDKTFKDYKPLQKEIKTALATKVKEEMESTKIKKKETEVKEVIKKRASGQDDFSYYSPCH